MCYNIRMSIAKIHPLPVRSIWQRLTTVCLIESLTFLGFRELIEARQVRKEWNEVCPKVLQRRWRQIQLRYQGVSFDHLFLTDSLSLDLSLVIALNQGFRVNHLFERGPKKRSTLLEVACDRPVGKVSLALIHALVLSRASINGDPHATKRPLHNAVRHRNVALVRYLIAQGADIRALDASGNDALAELGMMLPDSVMQDDARILALFNNASAQGCCSIL